MKGISTQEYMRLLYFFDPLCGWCHGFHSVLEKIQQQFEHIEIHFICGGMVVGKNVGTVGEKGQFYLKILPRLTELSGATFGEAYKAKLNDGSYFTSSLYPSIAFNIVNTLQPEKAMDFLGALHKQIFVHGMELQTENEVVEAAQMAGINNIDFGSLLQSQTWIDLTQKDFALTSNVGITGFPCLVAEIGGKLYLVSQGFASFENLEDTLNQLLLQEELA